MSEERQFLPLNLALMTISDSRTAADDKSGAMLKRLTTEAGHQIHEQCIVRDDIYQIRAAVSRWIADPEVQVPRGGGWLAFALASALAIAITWTIGSGILLPEPEPIPPSQQFSW